MWEGQDEDDELLDRKEPERTRASWNRHVAHRHSETPCEVTEHLRHRHPAPLAMGAWSQAIETGEQLSFHLGIEQTLVAHGRGEEQEGQAQGHGGNGVSKHRRMLPAPGK